MRFVAFRLTLRPIAPVLMLCLGLAACEAGQAVGRQSALTSTVPAGVRAPRTIDRLAVVHPETADRELAEAYHRLEGSAFRLKEQRPGLHIVDRSHLERVLTEQRLHLTGLVSDTEAVRVGRLLGVDSLLVYEIEPPTYRQRFLSRHGYTEPDEAPGLVIVTKVILVETAEVVYHNVVTARLGDQAAGSEGLSLHAALDRAIGRTLSDLLRAFE